MAKILTRGRDHMQNIEELIKRAEEQLGCTVALERDHKGQYAVVSLVRWSNAEDLHFGTYEQAVAKLKEWATPKFVTVTFPIEKARSLTTANYLDGEAIPIADAIRAELLKLDLP